MKKYNLIRFVFLQNKFFLLCLTIFCMSSCQKIDFQNGEIQDILSVPDLEVQPLMAISDLHSFKVMSFNIRHNDPGDPQTMTERGPLIKQIIVDNTPDIFGLQEFSYPSFKSWFIAEMQTLGYDHTDIGTAASPKVIFYKTARFTLQRDGRFQLGASMPKYTGTWAVVKDNITSRSYFLCNSHWIAGAAQQAGRLVNAQAVVDKVKAENTSNYPVLVFGDFNAVPGTDEIELLKSGLDVIDALGDSMGDETFHRWVATGHSKLDWVMSNRKMGFRSWKVITTSYDGKWPSDHWPVMATYVPAIFAGPNTDEHGTSASASTKFNFADINGDNKADKVYWNPGKLDGSPRIWLSNGDGTYTYATSHAASKSSSTSTRYHYADVNGDGKADLIVWNPSEYSGHTRVFLATSGGNFSSTFVENNENGSTSATTIYSFADVNGDGKADKIRWTPSVDGGGTRINLATSGGNFSATTISDPTGATSLTDTRFYFADMNADGKADKIVWNRSLNSGRPIVYFSDGDGTFTYSSSFSTTGATGTAATTQFYFADLDGDGRAEKIYWNPANFLGKVKVYYAQTDNTFAGPVYSLRGTSQSTNTFFYFEDVNGDGKADQIRWNPTLSGGILKNYFAN